MAYDMIKTVLNAEALAAKNEAAAQEQAQAMREEADATAQTLRKAQIEQANNQAKLILSEARQTADGVLKQAEKLAQMRRAKVIADTEKKYDDAIAAVLRAISE